MPRRAETRNTIRSSRPTSPHLTLGIEQTQQQQHHPQPLHRILVKTNKNPNTSSQTATASTRADILASQPLRQNLVFEVPPATEEEAEAEAKAAAAEKNP
ncbi:hypothetical protein Slin14017_G079300 [Septoria linicola]|nr:hypothetical protein Slin14017_G079300 [Septoria linicola]